MFKPPGCRQVASVEEILLVDRDRAQVARLRQDGPVRLSIPAGSFEATLELQSRAVVIPRSGLHRDLPLHEPPACGPTTANPVPEGA